MLNIKDTEGVFSYADLISTETRPKVTADATTSYSAAPLNLGLRWRFAKAGEPSLGVVVHDFGDTQYTSSKPDLRPSFKRKASTSASMGDTCSARFARRRLLCHSGRQTRRYKHTSVQKKWERGLNLLLLEEVLTAYSRSVSAAAQQVLLLVRNLT